MDQFKRFSKIVVFILMLNIASSFCINADSSKQYNDYNPNVTTLSYFGLDDNYHFFSYIKSGRVEHRNYSGAFMFIFPINLGNGIGHIGIGRNFNVHLKGEGNETRLSVNKILRVTSYNEDIKVNIKGFIGVFQPTGGLSGGYLFGFALITKITIL